MAPRQGDRFLVVCNCGVCDGKLQSAGVARKHAFAMALGFRLSVTRWIGLPRPYGRTTGRRRILIRTSTPESERTDPTSRASSFRKLAITRTQAAIQALLRDQHLLEPQRSRADPETVQQPDHSSNSDQSSSPYQSSDDESYFDEYLQRCDIYLKEFGPAGNAADYSTPIFETAEITELGYVAFCSKLRERYPNIPIAAFGPLAGFLTKLIEPLPRSSSLPNWRTMMRRTQAFAEPFVRFRICSKHRGDSDDPNGCDSFWLEDTKRHGGLDRNQTCSCGRTTYATASKGFFFPLTQSFQVFLNNRALFKRFLCEIHAPDISFFLTIRRYAQQKCAQPEKEVPSFYRTFDKWATNQWIMTDYTDSPHCKRSYREGRINVRMDSKEDVSSDSNRTFRRGIGITGAISTDAATKHLWTREGSFTPVFFTPLTAHPHFREQLRVLIFLIDGPISSLNGIFEFFVVPWLKDVNPLSKSANGIPCINISRSIPYINPETGVAENAFVTCNLDIDDLPQLAKLFNLSQFNSIYGDPIAEKFSPCAGQPGNPQILACHDLPVGHNLRVDDTGLFTKDDDAPAPIRTDFAMRFKAHLADSARRDNTLSKKDFLNFLRDDNRGVLGKTALANFPGFLLGPVFDYAAADWEYLKSGIFHYDLDMMRSGGRHVDQFHCSNGCGLRFVKRLGGYDGALLEAEAAVEKSLRIDTLLFKKRDNGDFTFMTTQTLKDVSANIASVLRVPHYTNAEIRNNRFLEVKKKTNKFAELPIVLMVLRSCLDCDIDEENSLYRILLMNEIDVLRGTESKVAWKDYILELRKLAACVRAAQRFHRPTSDWTPMISMLPHVIDQMAELGPAYCVSAAGTERGAHDVKESPGVGARTSFVASTALRHVVWPELCGMAFSCFISPAGAHVMQGLLDNEEYGSHLRNLKRHDPGVMARGVRSSKHMTENYTIRGSERHPESSYYALVKFFASQDHSEKWARLLKLFCAESASVRAVYDNGDMTDIDERYRILLEYVGFCEKECVGLCLNKDNRKSWGKLKNGDWTPTFSAEWASDSEDDDGRPSVFDQLDLRWVGFPPQCGTFYTAFYANELPYVGMEHTTHKHDTSWFSFIDKVRAETLRGLSVLPAGGRLLTEDEIDRDPLRIVPVRRYGRVIGLYEFQDPVDPTCRHHVIRAHVFNLPHYVIRANLDRVDVSTRDESRKWIRPEDLEQFRIIPVQDWEKPECRRITPAPFIEQLVAAQCSIPSRNVVRDYAGNRMPFDYIQFSKPL